MITFIKKFLTNKSKKRIESKSKKNLKRLKKLYKLYSKFYSFNNKLINRFTIYGKSVIVILFFSLVFGGYISATMIFQIFTILFLFMIISVFYSIKFKTKLEIERILPKYCSKEKKLFYIITIKNNNKKEEKGLFLIDKSVDPKPSLNEFLYTPEFDEEKRNCYDKRMLYYRWLWLIKKNTGGIFEEHAIPNIAAGEKIELTINFDPTRRGSIFFDGVNIVKKDPFNLIKSFFFIKSSGNIIVLPKIYNISPPLMTGHRKYNQGGVLSAMKVGNSEDFISLRDYQIGDPVKNIHWKSYSRIQKPVVKEYSDEFFSRYGLILDTFLDKAYSTIFEEAVSVASSLINGIDSADSLIDLMFVGNKRYIFTSGRGVSMQENILNILASVKTCKEEEFEQIKTLVKEHCSLLNSLILILIKIDDKRKELLDILFSFNIPINVIIISENIDKTKKEIIDLNIKYSIKILRVNKIEEDYKKQN